MIKLTSLCSANAPSICKTTLDTRRYKINFFVHISVRSLTQNTSDNYDVMLSRLDLHCSANFLLRKVDRLEQIVSYSSLITKQSRHLSSRSHVGAAISACSLLYPRTAFTPNSPWVHSPLSSSSSSSSSSVLSIQHSQIIWPNLEKRAPSLYATIKQMEFSYDEYFHLLRLHKEYSDKDGGGGKDWVWEAACAWLKEV